MLKTFKLTFVLCFTILIACDRSLVVETKLEIPQPLASQLPLNMAVLYQQQLREYVYTENNEDRINWSISVGPSQIEMFDRVLPSMFKSIVEIERLSDAGKQQYDAILIPEIQDIQFALPHETKTDIHETWIKYNIYVQQADGETIANLNLTGYGKSPTNTSVKFLLNEKEGLLLATNQAYRDLAAKLITRFRSHPDIQQWLTSKSIEY